MDGNKVGGLQVKVYPGYNRNRREKNHRYTKKVSNYVNKFKELVELERKEEMERHEIEIKRLSGEERQKNGRAILHLRGRDEGTGLGNKYIVKFVRQWQGEKLPETEIKVGDLVMISKHNPLDSSNPTATVVEKTNYSITVVFDKKPPSFIYKKGLRMDLYVNDITFQRMLSALDQIRRAKGNLGRIRNILLGIKKPGWYRREPEIIEWVNDDLNLSQKKCCKKRLFRPVTSILSRGLREPERQ